MRTLSQGPQYTRGSERIFTWVFANPNPATQSWTNGVEFTGIQVTFSNPAAAETVKMLDLTNIGGGDNLNTYFAINSTGGDRTDYSNRFFTIPGKSLLGTYPNGDQFVNVNAGTSPNVIAYPNPSNGQFQVRIFGQNQPLVLTVYDTNGLIVYKRNVTTGSSGDTFADVNLPATAAGLFVLDIRDANGKQIGKQQIVIMR